MSLAHTIPPSPWFDRHGYCCVLKSSTHIQSFQNLLKNQIGANRKAPIENIYALSQNHTGIHFAAARSLPIVSEPNQNMRGVRRHSTTGDGISDFFLKPEVSRPRPKLILNTVFTTV